MYDAEPSRGRILIAVTGLSPQVVTETIWCLAQRDRPEIPNRIQIVTTTGGAELANALLPAALTALSEDLEVKLPSADIVILRDASGRQVAELGSLEDSTAAADTITAAVRAATARPDTAVHVSIAGGRKTMGCLAAMALALFGRPQDRLSHVLVPPEFQSRPDFFFPPREPRFLSQPDGSIIRTDRCRIELVELPFVRLRGRWHPQDENLGYAASVYEAQTALEPPSLLIDLAAGSATFGSITTRLSPSLLGVLAWFAECRRGHRGSVGWREADPGELLRHIVRAAGDRDRSSIVAARQSLKAGVTAEFLAEKVSRLNTKVRSLLGPESGPYLIGREGRRPHTAYRLVTPPDAIRMDGFR
jgi:CRISPR-associated protein (TIGR02584 family)